MREAIARARDRLGLHGQRTILFIDEIHRFNKAQQDALLPAVEDGTMTLVGATTENPYFEVIAPLISRAQVFELEPLARRAHPGAAPRRRRARAGLSDELVAAIAERAGGDARSALTTSS